MVTSSRVRGPGAMRAQANSAVPASHAAAASAAALGRRATARPTAASAAAVTAVCCGTAAQRGVGAVAPAGAVQAAHQDVVGVARLHAHADPPVGRPHGVGDPALAADQPGAGVHHPQREVGVLPEGAGEALVEAAHRGQRGAAVGEVGGDPAAGGQAGGAALPVGGAAVAGQRHPDPALAAGDVGGQRAEVLLEPLVPVGVGDDVVVEEGDPLRAGGAPAEVAGPRGAAAPGAHDADRRQAGALRPQRGPAGRSSTRTSSAGRGPGAAASASRRTSSDGRPMVGTTTLLRSSTGDMDGSLPGPVPAKHYGLEACRGPVPGPRSAARTGGRGHPGQGVGDQRGVVPEQGEQVGDQVVVGARPPPRPARRPAGVSRACSSRRSSAAALAQ